MSLKYRPEIDGLRAVAVLSVMIYHLKISLGGAALIPGGFLGVDLFFVLSGYLITLILLREKEETGRISFGQFYLRRVRRILPALFLVILVSLPAAWILFLPSELARFAESIPAALFFYSNVFWFYVHGEYGAQSSLYQPLLHTWSLAIEEQFYLLFPLFVLIVPKRWFAPAAGVALVLTLGLAEATTQASPRISFFSPVSRAWELLAGSMLAVAQLRGWTLGQGRRWAAVVPPVALAVVIASVSLISLDRVGHPGLATIPVVAATCALIWFMRPGEAVSRVLSIPAVVWIGKLSYSLYLWHYPIFAFGRISALGDPGPVDMVVWLILTFALSAAGYYLVERPFRFRLSAPRMGGGLAVMFVVILGFFGIVQTGVGLGQRTAKLDALYGDNEPDNEKLASQTWTYIEDIVEASGAGSMLDNIPPRDAPDAQIFPDDARLKVLVVGDSHGKDMFNALHQNREASDGLAFVRFVMYVRWPGNQLKALRASPSYAAADVILIAQHYTPEGLARIPAAIEAFKADGKRVIVTGHRAVFRSPSELPIFDWYLRRNGEIADQDVVDRLAYKYEAPGARKDSVRLAEIADAAGVPYLDVRSLACDDAAEMCDLTTPEGKKAMYDDHHWTLAGAAFYGRRAAEAGWFDVIAGD
ncbi:peptidoglycan/LPS O-acetylase OafA/YrhL [Maritimibacter alkaliphilus HTCC2654]|uniref:Probable O-antigen acetylase n=1 Tax=Maritimibacter alkaliphilus HTCC2654 TaxID=314271 RepID=A3VFC9_9RHOB|nr:acyltransferase family protein [Maritimibacter alkaliphilus]EAQ13044.1 probable O-antigen acetylase [Rhodobacterales bacterium HTCC2654] [Maritimibacter alkaliphilus HTCC2654]TYP79978.1 peptidoglycan/LPS O-acetylase OafA/YrhL [Maritimibacter alkaliphilus HTCC2654]